jgi:hypothetical protein
MDVKGKAYETGFDRFPNPDGLNWKIDVSRKELRFGSGYIAFMTIFIGNAAGMG